MTDHGTPMTERPAPLPSPAHRGRPAGSHQAQVAEQSVLSILARGLGSIVGFALMLVLAKCFGAAVYGEYRLVLALVHVLAGLTVFGMGNGILKHMPACRVTGDRAGLHVVLVIGFALSLALAIAFSLGLYAGCRLIAVRVFHEATLTPVIALSGCILIPTTLLRITEAIYTAHKKPFPAVFTNEVAARTVLLVLLGGLLAGSLRGSWAVAAATGLSEMVALGYLLVRLERLGLPWRAGPGARPWRTTGLSFLRFSGAMLFVDTTHFMLNRVDTIMLGMYDSSTVVGVYNVAARVSSLVNLLLTSITVIFAGAVAELNAAGRTDEMRTLARQVTLWLLSVTLPVLTTFAIFGRAILGFFGREYLPGEACMNWLAVARVGAAMTVACAPLLAMCGREKVLFWNNAGMMLANVVLNMLLIPSLGMTGAALATAIARMGATTVMLVQTARDLNIRVMGAGELSLAANLAAAAAIAWAARSASNSVGSAVAAAVLTLGVSIALTCAFVPGSWRGITERVKRRLRVPGPGGRRPRSS